MHRRRTGDNKVSQENEWARENERGMKIRSGELLTFGKRGTKIRFGFVRSGGLLKNENPKIRSGGLPKNENPKICLGGLPKNENPKIKIRSDKDSFGRVSDRVGFRRTENQETKIRKIGWASEERKTKKPRFVTFGASEEEPRFVSTNLGFFYYYANMVSGSFSVGL
ncbi:unnamed protein product [Rhizophagus irregularis]|nr:unnamed protein product [Rhizophagus irregularis]